MLEDKLDGEGVEIAESGGEKLGSLTTTKGLSPVLLCENVCAKRANSLTEGGVLMRDATSDGRSMKGSHMSSGRGVNVAGDVVAPTDAERVGDELAE